jgi:prevent-host-death family protein
MSVGGAMGGGRSFVDATGTPVPLRSPIRTVVATDPEVGALLVEIGATVIGCAGRLGEVPVIGDDRRPDAREVAALRPDGIITGTRDGRHDLDDPTVVDALRRTAPVIAVDLARAGGAVARAELRALLGPTGRSTPPPVDPLGELDASGQDVAELGPRAAALVRGVARTGHAAVLTDGGQDVAAIIDVADYRRLRELVELVQALRL